MKIRKSWIVATACAVALSVGGAAGYAVGSTTHPTDAEAQAAIDVLQNYLNDHKASPSPTTTSLNPTTSSPSPTTQALPDCAPTATWAWTDCQGGQSATQVIQGTVSGITDADHNAAFTLGATGVDGAGGVRVIVRNGQWAMESDTAGPSGALTTGNGGLFKVARAGNIFTIFYNGTQVTQQTIAGTYGNYMIPSVWQSTAGVAIRGITYGDGSAPTGTPTPTTTTVIPTTTTTTTPPVVPGGLKAGIAGTGAGNGAADRWMVSGPGVIKATGTWIDVYAGDAVNLRSGQEFGSWGTQPGQVIDVATGGFYQGHGITANWQAAADGYWNTFWQDRLTDIKNAWGTRPMSNLRIRPFHEFTGNWFEWSVSGSDATNFKTAWRRYAALVHATLPGALIVWSPANSYGSYDPANFWPGSAYADIVGPDTYNQWPHSVSVSDVQAQQINAADIGMEAWRARAQAWGVPFALPEWGNPAVDSGGGAGGGDAPNYVTEVFKWAKSHSCSVSACAPGQVEYFVYFNIASGYPAHFQLFDGSGADSAQPNTGNAFRNYVNA